MSMPTNFPIRSIKRPSDLNGIVNGQVPESLLVSIGKRNSKMHHTAARGWRCLMAHLTPHLAELGVDDWDLASIDPRTYQRQCEMFDGRKYAGGRYLPQSMWAAWEAKGGKWGKRDDGSTQQYTWQAQDRTSPEQWRRMAPNAMAAVPGTSPHGDALAVDLAVDDDDDAIADPITEAIVRFLMAGDLALNCGFAWSTKSEPWHLQWYVGDAVPVFVIAWEATQNPDVITPPVSEEDDMSYLFRLADGSVGLRGPSGSRRVSGEELNPGGKLHGQPIWDVPVGSNTEAWIRGELAAYDAAVRPA